MRLIIQTSSAAFGLGLLSEDGALLHEINASDRNTQSRNLGDLFERLMAAAGCELADIGEICVDLGPGGLSSTRAGVSFANALAFGSATGLSGVSALELLMLEARKTCDLPICSMRPAQGGLVFWAFFRQGQLEQSGCDQPQDALGPLIAGHGEIAVVGPLARLRLDPQLVDGLQLLDIDPPALDNFARATRRAPSRVGGVAVLEPITSAEGIALV
ncbi:tRNA (adenosine(37)-N6)-threonylcarbamoyltransferase complex dimerization subunit type 1 TsaB [Puniceibacterium sediminis]|uniref:tRNA threonylcarbamoyl adenosine modification protein YeaZ n=1 Tax=Puniceibacterium sediminis TaxID=1608407 RepID=A0A238YGE9_9RHOB|nr:tRNA (adenosine(37)-N6)-threonylcarbamoyltransferase complex dimerization subunit type 1 TsaB [Puniceibacterium sediminis]SNR70140.1 tRNA threonylcarbamoyl adenosine modification protein YeaZ [Puniceibacterium sediminis]